MSALPLVQTRTLSSLLEPRTPFSRVRLGASPSQLWWLLLKYLAAWQPGCQPQFFAWPLLTFPRKKVHLPTPSHIGPSNPRNPFLTGCTLLARHLLCKCPAFFNRPSWTTGSKCNNAEAETLSVQRSPLALIGLYVQKGRRSPVIVVDDRWLSIIVARLCSEPTASD